MIKEKTMRKTAIPLIAVFVLLVTLGSAVPALGCPPPPPPPTLVSDLIAGQHYDVGDVTISDDGVNLYIQIAMEPEWQLVETHLYVGTDIPTKSAPGKFPYKDGHPVYTIPLADIRAEPGDTVYIALHAVVRNGCWEETAWADSYGIPFGHGWAMYLAYETTPLFSEG
jgi:hypothetical protein